MLARSSKAKSGNSGPKPVVGPYTAMMFVAFAALVAGCVLLVLELGRYDWKSLGG